MCNDKEMDDRLQLTSKCIILSIYIEQDHMILSCKLSKILYGQVKSIVYAIAGLLLGIYYTKSECTIACNKCLDRNL